MAKNNLMTMTSAAAMQLLQMFLYLIPILTAVITLSYLGYTFQDDQADIDPADWRRKWLIFFAWLTVAVMVLNIIMGTATMSILMQGKKK